MATCIEKFKTRLPVMVLLLATTFFWSFYDRYIPDGPVLLEATTLAEASRKRGNVSESNGQFLLNVVTPEQWAEVRFRLPDALNYSRIRVRGHIRTQDVVPGRYRWRCARLLLVQYDAENKWMPGHHGVVAKRGTADWSAHDAVFEIFPDATYTVVALQQGGSAGSAWFDRIEAQPVRVRASFAWWRIFFTVLWLAAAVHYFPLCRLHRRKLKGLVILNVMAILFGALLPGEWIEDGAERARHVWVKVTASPAGEHSDSPPTGVARDKDANDGQMDRFVGLINNTHRIGHFILFASLCFLVYLSAALERQHPSYFLKVGFDVLLFSAVTEALQCLTLDRSAAFSDLLVDVYGMIAAFILFVSILPLVRRFEA